MYLCGQVWTPLFTGQEGTFAQILPFLMASAFRDEEQIPNAQKGIARRAILLRGTLVRVATP
jgi:hypothetical protein